MTILVVIPYFCADSTFCNLEDYQESMVYISLCNGRCYSNSIEANLCHFEKFMKAFETLKECILFVGIGLNFAKHYYWQIQRIRTSRNACAANALSHNWDPFVPYNVHVDPHLIQYSNHLCFVQTCIFIPSTPILNKIDNC